MVFLAGGQNAGGFTFAVPRVIANPITAGKLAASDVNNDGSLDIVVAEGEGLRVIFGQKPVIAPNTRFQPIYVRDLGRAIALAALEPERHGGTTYELGGAETLTMRALNERIAAMAGQSPDFVDLPDFVAAGMAKFGFLPGAPLSSDQWKMLQHDNVAAEGPGLDAFGIVPTPLEAVAPEWLGRFVSGGRFAARATA